MQTRRSLRLVVLAMCVCLSGWMLISWFGTPAEMVDGVVQSDGVARSNGVAQSDGVVQSSDAPQSSGAAEVHDTTSIDRAAPSKTPATRSAPYEAGWIQRTFPYFKAAPDAYQRAFAELKRMRLSAKRGAGPSWTFAGPTHIGGRVVDLAFDPRNTNTLYAAAATGGVFRSIDRGASWEPIFDDQPILTIGDIALAPSNPDIMYVGTGESNGSFNNYAGAGVYRSEDTGETWSYIGLAETTSIGRVRVHPGDPNTVYVAAIGSYYGPDEHRGVYKTEDGGSSWEKVLAVNDSTGVIDLVIHPDNPDTLFAASWQRVRRVTGSRLYGRGSGIWRSFDGGQTWDLMDHNRGLPNPDNHLDAEGRARVGRVGIDISRSHPDTLYAFYSDGNGYLGFYRSNNGGDSWIDADPDRRLASPSTTGDDNVFLQILFTFNWYFGQTRVDPGDPEHVFVGDVLLMDTDGDSPNWRGIEGSHVDYHALTFHPGDPDIVAAGNDGGVMISEDGGNSWQTAGALPITQIYEISFDPNNPERLYAGTQDNHAVRTKSGFADDWHDIIPGGDAFDIQVDPLDPSEAWVMVSLGRLFRVQLLGVPPPTQFLDNKTSGTIPEDEPRNWNSPFAFDPTNTRIVYFGTNRVWRSDQRVQSGHPFEPVSQDLSKGLGYERVGTLTRISPQRLVPGLLYAGTDDGNVWISEDYADSWTNITGNLPLRAVTRVVPDPADANTVYVTFSGLFWKDRTPHVYRSRNRGATWQNISSNLPDIPVNAFAVDPKEPDHLFIGTDIGAFFTANGGDAWQPLNDGMPLVTVTDLEVNELDRLLIASTYGRGSFTLNLDDVGTAATYSDGDAELPSTSRIAGAYPNPFSSSTTLEIWSESTAEADVQVYDMLGRRIASIWHSRLTPGINSISWNGRDDMGRPAASGRYVIRVLDGNGRSIGETVLLKVPE